MCDGGGTEEVGAELGIAGRWLVDAFAGWCRIVLVMRAERARGQWGINYCARALLIGADVGATGQCWKKFLLDALPLKWDLGSAGEENAYGTAFGVEFGQCWMKFCFLHCLWSVIRAVQERSFAFCTARGVGFGQYRERFCF